MREFFLDEFTSQFKLFGLEHLLCLSLLLIGLTIVFIFRNKISTLNDKTKKTLKILMIVILMLNRLLYVGSYIFYDIYTWKENLPLHFCFVTGYLFIFSLILDNKKLFKIAYFFTFIGPFIAIIWPGFESTFDCYIFYEFFISHHMLIFFVFFTFYMNKIEMNKKDILKAILWANILFIFAILFNKTFGTNYIFSDYLPPHVIEIYPFLQNVHPIFLLEILGTLVLLVAYIPIYLKNKEKTLQ